jgi:hypothetical protein
MVCFTKSIYGYVVYYPVQVLSVSPKIGLNDGCGPISPTDLD